MNVPELSELISLSRCEAHSMQRNIHITMVESATLGANLVIDCLKDGDIQLKDLVSKFRAYGYHIAPSVKEKKDDKKQQSE